MRPVVVSLCDRTGNMVRPWAEAGFECWCVDVEHSIRKERIESVGDGVMHFTWGDCRSWTPPRRPDIGFGFSPCTHLTVSGARDFEAKGWAMLRDGVDLFHACRMAFAWAGCPYALENPVGRLSTIVGEPDYIFDPCDYGDPYTKQTCIWAGGGFIMPQRVEAGDMFAAATVVEPTLGSKMHKMPPSEDRAHLRSETPMGFARAVFEANAPRILANFEIAT